MGFAWDVSTDFFLLNFFNNLNNINYDIAS